MSEPAVTEEFEPVAVGIASAEEVDGLVDPEPAPEPEADPEPDPEPDPPFETMDSPGVVEQLPDNPAREARHQALGNSMVPEGVTVTEG